MVQLEASLGIGGKTALFASKLIEARDILNRGARVYLFDHDHKKEHHLADAKPGAVEPLDEMTRQLGQDLKELHERTGVQVVIPASGITDASRYFLNGVVLPLLRTGRASYQWEHMRFAGVFDDPQLITRLEAGMYLRRSWRTEKIDIPFVDLKIPVGPVGCSVTGLIEEVKPITSSEGEKGLFANVVPTESRLTQAVELYLLDALREVEIPLDLRSDKMDDGLQILRWWDTVIQIEALDGSHPD